METESQTGIQESLYLQAMETVGPRSQISTKRHAYGIELRTVAGFVLRFQALRERHLRISGADVEQTGGVSDVHGLHPGGV